MGIRNYKITKPGAQHARMEERDGKKGYVFYKTDDIIRMDDRHAVHPAYRHLGLVIAGTLPDPAPAETGAQDPAESTSSRESPPLPPAEGATEQNAMDAPEGATGEEPNKLRTIGELINEGEETSGAAEFNVWRQRVIEANVLEAVPAKKAEVLEALRNLEG